MQNLLFYFTSRLKLGYQGITIGMEKSDYIIIVAGGKGLRMGTDIPKQFLPVGGKPVLMRTIERFQAYSESEMAAGRQGLSIILVLPKAQQAYWHELCEQYAFTVEHTIADGGETRFHSSQNGLRFVPDDAQGVVGIHDGVRPFVSAEVIRRCFEAAKKEGAAIPVMPVTETLRHIDGNGEGHNVLRSDYRIVQTPQTFDIQLAKRAFQQPYSDTFTDDASVVEAMGNSVAMVDGNRENIKLTTPYDLMIAEQLVTTP